jgi:anaerobic magnesium-protoporphyrin IX monomethyl ester cyclase
MNILWPVLDLYRGNNLFLGIMTIASLLESYGHHSEVVDADYRAVADKLQKGDFKIVAFSTMSLYCQSYLRLNRKLKETFPIFSVFGGPHPTYFPEMVHQEGVDGVCIGEGEFAMLDLVENLSAGKPITDIPNWWVKKDGRIHKNAVRPLIEDLDELPFPNHEIFRSVDPKGTWRTVVMTSRGCPYSCTYCFNNAYKKLYAGCGKILRRRSVDDVIHEMETIKRHSCYKYIHIIDDLFTLSSRWLKEFADAYGKRIRLPFSCFARVEHITPEVVNDLKRAGCGRIIVGVETGDERIRREIFKRNMSDEEIISAARMIKKMGIKLMTTNILGIPGASLDSDIKTFELNARLKPDYAGVNLLQPYPGTEIYEYARRMGLLSSEVGEGERKEVMISSVIKFPSEMERRKAENFEKFFSLVVVFPAILPLVKRLIRWPQNRIFNTLHSLWTNYCVYFRIIPFRIGILAIWEKIPIRVRRISLVLLLKVL